MSVSGIERIILADVVEAIYRPAGTEISDDGAAFCAALAASAQLLDSKKAVLLNLSMTDGTDGILAAYGLNPETCRKILESRRRSNSFLAFCRGWDQDNIYDSGRLGSVAESFCDELQVDSLDYALAGVAVREGNCCIILCFYRSRDDGAFTDAERKSLASLLPHWRRSLAIRKQLDQVNLRSQAAHRILDHAPFAILLVDSCANVVYENYRARVIHGIDDGLVVRDGQLRFSDSDARKKFFSLFEAAAGCCSREQEENTFMMTVDRPSRAKPYQLMILPVADPRKPGGLVSRTCAVFIYDPMVNLPVDTDMLCALEGLTRAEAKLCQSLYVTKNLSEAAIQLDVSISTAKTHLLNTFRKIGINSQAELMKYLAHMPKVSAETKH